ncbi:MAG: DivIVA domain-containing protein [Coriobacteriia bacterium]|jgi:cell division initiation protein|nr:DivIVA domain-containing protein [Coriobacteriia bacterium]
MRLTPLDIHHKEFRRSIRGYDDKEVDDFLDTVADELERLFKENIDLSERIEAAEERVRTYQQMETTLNNTLVTAQRSAEDIVASARVEAGSIMRDAELKAKEVIHDALTQKQRAAGELTRIKQAEEEFRARFKRTLDEFQAAIQEVELPEDVDVLLGTGEDATVDDALLTPAPGTASFREPDPAAAVEVEIPESDYLIPVEPAPASSVPAEPPSDFEFRVSGTSEPLITESTAESEDERSDASAEMVSEPGTAVEQGDLIADAWPTEAMPAVETAPAPGFVTSVHLGETESPDLPEDLGIELPREFTLGSIDALGEREDDIDIEEID